jgi:hypothetical protein
MPLAKRLWTVGTKAMSEARGYSDGHTWSDLSEHHKAGWAAVAKHVLKKGKAA